MRFGYSAIASFLLSSFHSIARIFVPSQLTWATLPPRASSGASRRIRIGGRLRYYPNGAREVSRRLRQIAEGRLTASNGVV